MESREAHCRVLGHYMNNDDRLVIANFWTHASNAVTQAFEIEVRWKRNDPVFKYVHRNNMIKTQTKLFFETVMSKHRI